MQETPHGGGKTHAATAAWIFWNGPRPQDVTDEQADLYMQIKLFRSGRNRLDTLAKLYGKLTNREGRIGGWVYDGFTDDPICHGWNAYAWGMLTDGVIVDDPPRQIAYLTDKGRRIVRRVAGLIEAGVDGETVRLIEGTLRKFSHTGHPNNLTDLGKYGLSNTPGIQFPK